MEKRIVYKIEDGEKKEIEFKNIKKGMLIELYEDHNTQVKDDEGNFQFLAASDAFENENGVLAFETIS